LGRGECKSGWERERNSKDKQEELRRDGKRAKERWTQEQENEASAEEETMGCAMMPGGGEEAATKEGQAEEGGQSLRKRQVGC
jgi:hypothetical protein